MRHRPFRDVDAQAIQDFSLSDEERAFFYPQAVYPLTSQQMPGHTAEQDLPTVVLIQDRVVGFANIIDVRPKLYCKLGNLIVHPSHRRKGVASYLVKTMIQMAVEKSAARFFRVACYSHNTAAYQLFHGLGFRPADMVPKTVPGGETVLLVNMELACRRMKYTPVGP